MRLRPLPLDLALAALLSVPAFVGTVDANRGRPVAAVLTAVPLALLQTVPLGWRRVRPLTVLAITVAATIGLFAIGGGYFPVGVVVALYSVATHRERPQALWALLRCRSQGMTEP